jgi:hypothetical protein
LGLPTFLSGLNPRDFEGERLMKKSSNAFGKKAQWQRKKNISKIYSRAHKFPYG